jgi:plastocyanin
MTKNTYILVTVSLVVVLAGFSLYQKKIVPSTSMQQEIEQVNNEIIEEDSNVGAPVDSNSERVDLARDVLPAQSQASPNGSAQNPLVATSESTGENVEAVAKPASEIEIDMVGTNYDFDIKEIKVKKGDVITINLRSEGGFHDLVVDEFSAATERIDEGGAASVTFVAKEVGTFQYYCSVGRHRQLGMVGYLTVED